MPSKLIQQVTIRIHRDLSEAALEGRIDLVDATVERVHGGDHDEVRRDLDLFAVGDGELELSLAALDVGQRLAEDAADVGARELVNHEDIGVRLVGTSGLHHLKERTLLGCESGLRRRKAQHEVLVLVARVELHECVSALVSRHELTGRRREVRL